jgi:hypothetical protein
VKQKFNKFARLCDTGFYKLFLASIFRCSHRDLFFFIVLIVLLSNVVLPYIAILCLNEKRPHDVWQSILFSTEKNITFLFLLQISFVFCIALF